MDGSILTGVVPLDLDGVKITWNRLKSGERRAYYRHIASGEQLGDSRDHSMVLRKFAAYQQVSPNAPISGTFDMMVRDFCASDAFKGRKGKAIKQSTRKFYNSHLEPLRLAFGSFLPTEITAEMGAAHLATLDKIPATKFQRLTVMRLLFNWKAGRRKYGIKYSMPDELFAQKPKPRATGWTWEMRKKMYDGLPEERLAAAYRSMSDRERQKRRLRDRLRDMGLLGEELQRTDYSKSIEEIEAEYITACAERNITPEKIFDGMTLQGRAASYPANKFSEFDRRDAKERRAYMRLVGLAAYYWGQRRGDTLQIARHKAVKRPDKKENNKYLLQARDEQGRLWVFAHIVQDKTGATVEVPAASKLRTALEDHEWRCPPGSEEALFLFANTEGGLWDSGRFSQYWREECELLGIDGVTLHDLRRTIRTDLGLAKCLAEEIHAVTGHDLKVLADSAMAATYTLENRQFAVNAIEKLEKWEDDQEEYRKKRAALGIEGDDIGEVDFLRQPKMKQIAPPTPQQIKRRERVRAARRLDNQQPPFCDPDAPDA